MRERVGIARAIAGKPKYLLYDEPTSGLDPVNADVIDGLVERLRDELGVTSVVVSHDVRGSFRVADRVALLWQAKIRAVGTPEQILASRDAAVLPGADATASVGSADFLGAKYVAYNPGSKDEPLPSGAPIPGVAEEQFTDIASRAASNASQLIENVNRGLNPGQLAIDLHNTLVVTQRGMKALSEASNGPMVQQTTQTLKAVQGVMARIDTVLGTTGAVASGRRL